MVTPQLHLITSKIDRILGKIVSYLKQAPFRCQAKKRMTDIINHATSEEARHNG